MPVKRINDLKSLNNSQHARYDFSPDTIAGGTIADLAGANTGTLVGHAYTSGGELILDGTGDYLNCGNSATLEFGYNAGDLTAGLYTISVWIYSTGAGQDGTGGVICGRWASNKGLLIYLFADGRGLYYQADVAGWTTNQAVAQNAWHHIAFVSGLHGVTSNRFYIDGIEVASRTSVQCNTTTASFYVGNYDAAATQCFKGKIKDFRIYGHRELSAAEIMEIYTAGVTGVIHDGLIGYWPMEEGTGTETVDRIGINNGTLYNTPTWINAKFGKCIEMSGPSSEYISFGNARIPISTDFSISLWFKYYSASGIRCILSQYTNGTTNRFSININQAASTGLEAANALAVTGNSGWILAKTGLVINKWYHVIVTHEGNVGKLYVNANLEATDTSVGNVQDTTLMIGKLGDLTYYLTGAVDELRIYNRALSVAEIKAMYFSKYSQYQ